MRIQFDFTKKLRWFVLYILSLIICSCSYISSLTSFFNSDPQPRPSLQKYKEDTDLLVNICGKLQSELDAEKLHKVAVSMQQAKVVVCINFNNECDHYGAFLKSAVNASSDGVITPEERKELEIHFLALKASVKEGLYMLRSNP